VEQLRRYGPFIALNTVALIFVSGLGLRWIIAVSETGEFRPGLSGAVGLAILGAVIVMVASFGVYGAVRQRQQQRAWGALAVRTAVAQRPIEPFIRAHSGRPCPEIRFGHLFIGVGDGRLHFLLRGDPTPLAVVEIEHCEVSVRHDVGLMSLVSVLEIRASQLPPAVMSFPRWWSGGLLHLTRKQITRFSRLRRSAR
jgi:hypothetical protein